MNNKEREIISLLMNLLSFKYVENPCDVKGLAVFHNQTKEIIGDVKGYLDDLRCYDIPKERLNEIIEELKENE